MPAPSTPSDRAKAAARVAAIIFVCVIGISLIRALFSPIEPGKPHFDWNLTLRFSFLIGAVSFVALFVWTQATAAHAQPVVDILTEGVASADPATPAMFGFVALEYYWLVMNRTYVIFIAPEGLYGWLAQGPVAASNRAYFEPYQRMLLDEHFMRNPAAIQKLSSLPGGFFFNRSEIASVADDDRKKWGTGGMPHTGTIRVRLVSGISRDFIVLGHMPTGKITHKIASIVGLRITPIA